MQRNFPVPSNDEAYIYVSQLLQAYGISKGIHAHRRAKPYNMGTLYWQLNDCWPVVSWSSIDGLGNWKALHYEAKRAFEDILISTSESDGALKVHLINDSFSELKDRLNITHLDFFGKVRSENNISVTSPPDSSTIVYEFLIDQTPFERNTTFLELTFGPYKSLHFFSKPKDLKLPHSKINRTIEKVAHGFSVTLQSQTLQKAVFLVSKNNGKWSDNFFDLLPNETKTIMFLTKEPTTPIIEIKTLNNLY
jgi:beta-mannosidase